MAQQTRSSGLGILSLKSRRGYFDLIETFECIRGYSKVDYTQWFLLEEDLERRTSRVRERVVHKWNNLPDEMKERLTLDSFYT